MKTVKPVRKQYHVTAEDFCRIWQKAGSVDEVCALTGMPKGVALARASGYRVQGIRLKNFPRVKPSLDIEGINEMLRAIDGTEP